MYESFDLPLTFQGEEMQVPAEFQPYGYTYRIKITVQGTTLFFEPDEEKNYRAVLTPGEQENSKKLPKGLLETISEKLQELFS